MALLSPPSEANWVAGVDVTASFGNAQVRDAVNFLANKPIFVGVQTSTTTSLANNTVTSLGFDTNVVDSYSGHSTVTNNSRYVAQVAGWYRVSGVYVSAANATGTRSVQAAVNGTAVQGSWNVVNNLTAAQAPAAQLSERLVFLNVGDYVEIQGLQNSGGALATLIAANADSMLCVEWSHV